MDEYEIQFVERNANENPNNNHHPQRRTQQHPQTIRLSPRTNTNSPQVYAQPGLGVGLGSGCGVLGRMNTGQVIDMVAQIFAALMPLPGAPVATSDPGTDVPNLILYQSALAQYAKRDEQVRTLGNLIVKLVG
jgi:hypothetical protein